MPQTVQAEVDINGTVHLLEPLRVSKRTRAIVTLLEEENNNQSEGNVSQIIALLNNRDFKNRRNYKAEEIETQIEENRI